MDEIRFHPEAEAEYQSALAWYQARSPQAANRFEAEADRVLRSILATPELYPMVGREDRLAMLRRFPQSIIYRVRPGLIYVVALAHSRRSDEYWQGRT